MLESLLASIPRPTCICVHSFVLLLYVSVLAARTDAHENESNSVWFIKEPEDVIVTLDSGAILDCIVGTSDPKAEPIIHWRSNDGQAIDFLGDPHSSVSQLPNGSLVISKVVGQELVNNEIIERYSCIVEVISVGKIVSRTATVTFAKLPSLDKQPQSLNVYPKQTAHFACHSNSKPQPTVTWIKDQLPLVLDETRMIVLPSGSLEIDEVQVSDIGSYQCNISGLAGYRLSEKAFLTVSQDLEGSSRKTSPEFIAEPNETVGFEGDTITLDCAANGNPRPWIDWLKDGIKVDMADLDSRYEKVGTGALQITNVRESDAGHYQCRAGNSVDSVDTQATLSIHVAPRFVKHPSSIIASVNSDIELECKVYAKPEPKVYWLKNGDHVANSSLYLQVVNGNNLRILGVMESDYGIFQCLASNSAGNIQAAALLTVTSTESIRSQTGPPKEVEEIAVRPKMVTLKWKSPASIQGEILGYSIFYKEQDSNRERVVNTSRSNLEETNISGLSPNTTYIFRIAAITTAGLGETSRGHLVITAPELRGVPSPPLNVHAISSTTELRVSWSEPHITNGKIDKYKLYYYEYDSSEEHHIETEDTFYTLTGLKKFTEYFVWVVAYNHYGPGINSDEITVKTLSDVPSEPPTNVTVEATSSSSLTVRWDPPSPEGCNGVITGYKLRYRMRDRRGRSETVTTAGNKRVHVLTGLDKSSIYQVRIWAINVNGTGPPTDWYTIETYEKDLDETTVPDKPSDLKAKANGDSITVVWSPPKNTNILVREYIITWGKGIPDDYVEKLDGKQRHYVIKNLEPNSEYVISLRARNERGDGPLAYENVRTKLENIAEPITPLLPPIGLKATVVSSTSVVLFWTDTTLAPDQVVNDGRYYVVRYNQFHPSSLNTRYRFHNSTVLNYMIDDLKPFTQYEFVVKVVNGRRDSPWSMTVANTTWESAPGSPPRDVTVVNQNSPGTVSLSWQPPKIPNGHITSYVVSYTTDLQSKERDWVTEHVPGDKMSTLIKALSLDTTYYFHVKARNKKGFSISSPVVSITTPASAFGAIAEVGNLNKGKGLSNTTLMYIVIVASSVLITLIAISVVFLCCRKSNPTTPDRSKKGYPKGGKAGASNIKPPDLWIHHDQMELKNLDKNQDGISSNVGGGTLPKCNGDSTPPRSGTLEKHQDQSIHRDYQASYIGSQCQPLLMPEERISTLRRGPKPKLITLPIDNSHFREPVATAAPIGGTPTSSASINPAEMRPLYPRTQYTSRAHVTIDPTATESPYVVQPSTSVTYDSANQNVGVRDNQSNYGTSENAKRLQGHPLKSFSVPAPPPQSAPTTPQQKHIITVRAQGSSPFKKSVYAGGTSTSPIPKAKLSSDELPRIQASYSTEELNQEMANLEGLMKDLNAITASEFQC
ncbi:neogenin isoform X2 [Cimex lectularius]|uniref:Neogenin n=1 Tax=Cimex lectularius TaxID=79782 RepID=A0A8I6RAE5_CIMLE|nr:neogenin isoform X2 [Cimex lectularius]